MSGFDPAEAPLEAGREAPEPTRRTLDSLMGFRARRLHALIQAHWARWFADGAPGLTPTQGGALLLIGENPGIGQGQLAALMRVEAPSLSQTLSPLFAEGLVERRASAADRRAVTLRLTAKGRTTRDLVRDGAPAHEAAALANLTAAERAELLRLMDKALAETPAAPGRRA